MTLFISVRIVHSPLEDTYTVEYKSFLFWKFDAEFKYRKSGVRSEAWLPYRTQEEALQAAKDRAELLLARAVVWQGSKYFWM